MAFFPRNSDVAAQETRSPNIDMQTKDLVPRINDFGEVRYRAELPDDSGESTYQAELPDDSGETPYRAELPDDSGDIYQEDRPDDSGEALNQSMLPGNTKDFRNDTDSPNAPKDTEASIASGDNSSDIPNDAEASDSSEKFLPEKMDLVVIRFKCPPDVDKDEFERQLKAQEKGLNQQSVAENKKNRDDYQQRKEESGNERAKEAKEAQKKAREEARTQRIAENQAKGMSYAAARAEADAWLESQNALHDPDQIAGGDPEKVSGMGDKKVNASIGGQWKFHVAELEKAVDDFSKNYTQEELKQIKMNVKLEVI